MNDDNFPPSGTKGICKPEIYGVKELFPLEMEMGEGNSYR
jgi:hypothetical protein